MRLRVKKISIYLNYYIKLRNTADIYFPFFFFIFENLHFIFLIQGTNYNRKFISLKYFLS